MGSLLLTIRSEIRTRRVAMGALACIVALVSFVTAAGTAGALRTSSALDRFEVATVTSDVEVRALSPDLGRDPAEGVALARALEAVDGVEAAGTVAGFPLDVAGDYFMVYSSLDGSTYETADRPVLRSGRMPRTPDEIAVNRTAVEQLDLRIGSVVRGPTLRTADIDTVFGESGFPGFLGPELSLTVVGVIERGADLSGRATASGVHAVATPGFAERYGDRVASYVTEVRLTTTEVTPRLRGEIVDVAAATVGDFEIGVQTTAEAWSADARQAHRILAFTIAGFTAVSALAGLFVVGQAIGREVTTSARHDTVLRAVGMSRRLRVAVAVGPALIASAAGALVGFVGSVAVSDLFPLASARRAEVDPGIRLDLRAVPPVLLTAGVVGLWAVATAWQLTRRHTSSRRSELTGMGARMGRLGASPSATVGVRLALEPSSGHQGVPARSAMLGAAVAIAAMVAVVVVGRTADDLAAEPARYGWAWSTLPDDLTDDPEANAGRAAQVGGVHALAGLAFTTVSVGAEPVPAAALEPVAGSMGFTQVDGRQPTGPGEVAVSPSFAERTGLAIGDELEVDDPAGSTVALEIVGTIVPPPIDDIGRDVVLSPDGLAAVAQSEPTFYVAIEYEPEADVAAVERRLTGLGYRFTETSRPAAPSEVQQFRSVRRLLDGLVVFLALLGGIGLLHVLAATVRRRGRDLAVLRALGFVRRDVRRVIAWQAVTLACVGFAVGIPVGLAAGRTAWLLAVSSLDIVDRPATPGVFLASAVAVGMVGSVVLSAVPGAIASRRRTMLRLRSE